MKNAVLILVCLTFIANTVAVSADVMFCAPDTMDAPSTEIVSESEMPCHEIPKDDPQEHCKDDCFCPLYTTNQIPFFSCDSLNLLFTDHLRISSAGVQTYSTTLSSIYRPPIYRT